MRDILPVVSRSFTGSSVVLILAGTISSNGWLLAIAGTLIAIGAIQLAAQVWRHQHEGFGRHQHVPNAFRKGRHLRLTRLTDAMQAHDREAAIRPSTNNVKVFVRSPAIAIRSIISGCSCVFSLSRKKS